MLDVLLSLSHMTEDEQTFSIFCRYYPGKRRLLRRNEVPAVASSICFLEIASASTAVLHVSCFRAGKQEVAQKTSTATQLSSTPLRYKIFFKM